MERETIVKCKKRNPEKSSSPSYHNITMSCFKLLDSLYHDLNSMVSQFWWDQKDKKRKMAWTLWENLAYPNRKPEWGLRI